MRFLFAVQEAHVVNELPFPAVFFGILAFVLLMTLLLVTYSYRDVALRNDNKHDLDSNNQHH